MKPVAQTSGQAMCARLRLKQPDRLFGEDGDITLVGNGGMDILLGDEQSSGGDPQSNQGDDGIDICIRGESLTACEHDREQPPARRWPRPSFAGAKALEDLEAAGRFQLECRRKTPDRRWPGGSAEPLLPDEAGKLEMELRGLEPLTFALPARRSSS